MAVGALSVDETPWMRASSVAALLAVDPDGLGGVALRAPASPVREAWLCHFRSLLPPDGPWRRMPPGIAEGRLIGGLDLAGTLATGRPVVERGLLTEAAGGIILAPMAERLSASVTGPLCAALDTGLVRIERDGLALHSETRFAVILLDEGIGDERAPAALMDRVAFVVDLEGARPDDASFFTPEDVAAARGRLGKTLVDPAAIEALCAAGMALGVASLRAATFALRVARAAAALDGREQIDATDVTLAATLVFAPRATRLPQAEPDTETERDDPDDADAPSGEQDRDPLPDPPSQEASPSEPSSKSDPADDGDRGDASLADSSLADQCVEAAKAAIPAGLLSALTAGLTASRAAAPGRAGLPRVSLHRGRPAGTRHGMPGRGARLAIVETLRAAAPWQAVRRQALQARPSQAPQARPSQAPQARPSQAPQARQSQALQAAQSVSPQAAPGRVLIRRDDFRIGRFKQRTETTTIFVVDASGSAALNRLAEVKGAVELILADCYVRRDSVALIAFRGTGAEMILPPTRSLARAKRALAGQRGGGGTPLAAAIDAAVALADTVRRKGTMPLVVFLTDGRANIARDGRAGRAEAEADALAAARGARAAGLACLLIDIAPRPQPVAQHLAEALGAGYRPLPYVEARALSQAVLAADTDRRSRNI